MSKRKKDSASVFATVAVCAAGIAMIAMVAAAFGAFRGDGANASSPEDEQVADDNAVADPSAQATDIVTSAAAAMAGVSSVEFRLERSGAPIFIDQFDRIALNSLRGQFTVPGKAQAELEVTVNDNMATRLGAIALDDEVWISNPVTGDFETLPAGYDIDPSKFFDPKGGWQPLLANLRNVRLVGVEDRGGQRYHITGTAPAAQVSNITVGLVKGQDVAVDMWIHPDSYLVTAAEFRTTIDGGTSDWKLALDHYGDTFTIEPPANVRQSEASS